MHTEYKVTFNSDKNRTFQLAFNTVFKPGEMKCYRKLPFTLTKMKDIASKVASVQPGSSLTIEEVKVQDPTDNKITISRAKKKGYKVIKPEETKPKKRKGLIWTGHQQEKAFGGELGSFYRNKPRFDLTEEKIKELSESDVRFIIVYE